jgi:hypothetical protein
MSTPMSTIDLALVSILTIGVVSIAGLVCLLLLGQKAYLSGGAWHAPEEFTAFVSQVLRIATVIAIVATTLTLAIRSGKLDASVTGILSGIAGFVLGTSTSPHKGATPTSVSKNKTESGNAADHKTKPNAETV